jgi:hypothetical protein
VCFAATLRQVYYNLANYDDALTYALAAGTRFNPTDKSPFVQTLVCMSPRLAFPCAMASHGKPGLCRVACMFSRGI